MAKKKSINTAQKKSSRLATEGLINVATGKKGSVIVEINSETDFVARNETFQKFCDDVANTCLEYEVKDKDLLLKSNFINSDTLVETELTNVIAKLGENIVIKRLSYISEPGLFYQKYLHNAISPNSGKIGFYFHFPRKIMEKMLNLLLNSYVCILPLLIPYQWILKV